MHGPLARMQLQAQLRDGREAAAADDSGGGAARQVVSAYLKGGRELYVRSDALAAVDRDGRTVLELDAGAVRSAVAPDGRTVRVTWAEEGAGAAGAGNGRRSYCNLELDMKRMYPGRADRRAAEETEAPALARAIVAVARARRAAAAGQRWRADAERLLGEAAGEAGGGGAKGAPPSGALASGPCSGQLVVGPGEAVVGEYGGVQWSRGRGDACVTSRGVYMVDAIRGLCLDLPFELFEGCSVSNRTVSVRHAGSGGRAGEDEGGSFDLRVPGPSAGAQALADDILGAYSRCGEAEARRLGELEAKFSRLSQEELLVEAYGKQRRWEGDRALDEYAKLLAAKRWGAWYGAGSELYDHRVAAACAMTGVPLEEAGGLTADDKKLHGALRDHAEARAEYEARIRPLLADLFGMQAEGLPESEKRALLAVPHWRIIHEVVEEAARTGRRPGPSFVPPTARRYDLLAADICARMAGGAGGEDGGAEEAARAALGLGREGCEAPCPWTGEEAARILGRPGYAGVLAECDAIRKEYGMLDIVPPRALSLLAGRRLRDGARVRTMRVYRAWAAGRGAHGGAGGRRPVLPPFDDPYDYSWIEYLIDNTSQTADGLIRARFGMDAALSGILREARARSQEARARVAGAPVPPSAPRGGVHGDAWYDPDARLWFSANTLASVAESPLAAAGPDECERLHGVRATAFARGDIAMRHGLPAVRDGEAGLWALLPTMPDAAITRDIVADMERGSLDYSCAEAEACITNEGLLCEYTHAEYAIVCGSAALDMPHGSEARELATGSAVLPLGERMRRFEFAVLSDLLGVDGGGGTGGD